MAAEDDFFVTFKNVCFYTGIGIGSLFALIFLIWLCNKCLAAGILRWCEGLCECYRDCNCDNCCYVCCCCCLLEQLDKLCEDADCKSDCESSYNLCKQDYAKLNWKFFFKPSCCFCRQKNDWDGDDYNGRSFDGSRNIDLHSVTTLPYDYNNSRVSNHRVDNCNHIVTRQPTFELQHIQPTSPVSPTVYSNNYVSYPLLNSKIKSMHLSC
ncbi:uncharacterized protein LOC131940948 [Physella acuta]|uniref:uncharacterized protein LOC131940948 n=1 Tax=Physella acuta TaxID=109671 RepID=UPI0027DDB362|nr:uncharacterized protein LOC131940948 [Physella acuta]XP_059155865.1 uncharacterized protein LOC131940948 [Physella acuta]